MARDFWQSFRKVLTVGKINKTLTIPAFTARCGYDNASLKVLSQNDLHNAINFAGVTAITIEGWVRPQAIPPSGVLDYYTIFQLGEVTAVNPIQIALEFTDDTGIFYIRAQEKDATVNRLNTGYKVVFYGWQHFSFLLNMSTGAWTFVLNGDIDNKVTGTITTPDFSYTSGNFKFSIYNQPFIHFAELQIHKSVFDLETIKNNYNKHGGTDSTLFPDLLALLRINSSLVSGTDLYLVNDPTNYISLGSSEIDIEEYPTLLGFGASFIVTEFPISYTGGQYSLKYPIDKPSTDCNFCLCVRWTDLEGILQRRKFWTVGEDIHPDPLFYAGEPLNDTAVLEIWNIDGNDSVDLADAMTLVTSLTSNAQTSKDHSASALVSLVENPNIWAAFPWTNTQVFNEQNPF